MAETEKTLVEAGKAVMEATAPDAPKKNAVAAEPMKSLGSAEDLGPAVVKPTDSNPDATKKMKKVSDQVSATADKGGTPDSSGRPDTQAGTTKLDHPGQSAKVEETKKDGEIVKEGEMPKAALDALNKNKEKKEESADEKSKEKEVAKEDKEVKSDKADDKKELDVKEH